MQSNQARSTPQYRRPHQQVRPVQLNPNAGSFNPPQTLTPPPTPPSNRAQQPVQSNGFPSTALVPRQQTPEADDDSVVQVSHRDLQSLTSFFHNEILSLRTDVEMLRQGGWTVTVGAFQHPEQFDNSAVEATRQRLESSNGLLGSLTSSSHLLAPATARRTPVRSSTTEQDASAGASTADSTQEPAADLIGSTSRPTTAIQTLSKPGILKSKYATKKVSNGIQKPKDEAPPKAPAPPRSVHPDTPRSVHPDTPLPTTEDPASKHMASQPDWKPFAVRNLRPLPAEQLAQVPGPADTETFSFGFLRDFFRGKWWGPGFYYVPVVDGTSINKSRTYYLLDASNEPYVPQSPGAHGAKLTAFFNPENPADVDGDEAENAFNDVPVFVKDAHPQGSTTSDGYAYMGMYSQLRYSDKLDYDRLMEHVPFKVRMFWAEQLADLARPRWITEALMKAFVPKPEYEGPLPGTGTENEMVRKEVGRHVRDLREWEDEAKEKVKALTKEEVFAAFEKEDAADPPGLRLWWEYLQCVGWDRCLYDLLVKEQQKFQAKKR